MADDEEARRLAAEIEARLAPQPTTFEQEREAIEKSFEAKREEARAYAADMAGREIKRTIGDIDDPDMADTLAKEADRISAKWEDSAALSIGRYDDQEAQRLERLRAEWRVELQPVQPERVVEAERKRTDDELERARTAAEEVTKDARDNAERDLAAQPNQAEEIQAQLEQYEKAVQEALERRERMIEAQARARLEHMLEPYGRNR